MDPERPADEGAGDQVVDVEINMGNGRAPEQGDNPPQRAGTQEFGNIPSRRRLVGHRLGLPLRTKEGERAGAAGPRRENPPLAQNLEQHPENQGERLPVDQEEAAAEQQPEARENQ